MSATNSSQILRRCTVALATLSLLLLPISAALAQASVTDADIERARQSQPVITDKDMENARQKYRMPSDAQFRMMPVPSTPNINALPQPQTASNVDLGAIARGFEANAKGIAEKQGLISGPGLLVFVSFSMPEATLERLVDQVARARATLVLRGFIDGSLQKTVLRIQQLIGKRHVAFQIDPQSFDRFAVRTTPSFVLVPDGARGTDCASGHCFAGDAYFMTSGDVSLDYALDYMVRASPAFSTSAQGFIDRVRRWP